MAATAQLTRGLTIGGKSYQQQTTRTGQGIHVAEATVNPGSPGVVTAQAQSSATISAATWSANVITFTTGTHNLVPGQIVTVTGVTPVGYNGTYVVISTPLATTFTVANITNPGAYTSGGSVAEPFTITCGAVPVSSLVAAARVDLFITIAGVTTCRYGCTIGAVVGNAISLTGGAGASFPANSTVVTCVAPVKTYLPILGANIMCYFSDGGTAGQSQFVFVQVDGTTVNYAPFLDVGVTDLWDNDLGVVANPFTTTTGGFVYASHNSTLVQTMAAGFLAIA